MLSNLEFSPLMDPIQPSKIEQPNVLAEPQEIVGREQTSTPEISPIVEVVKEEVKKERRKEEEKRIEQPLTPPSPPPVPAAAFSKDRLTTEIEEILEDDLKDLYLAMPKDKQAMFKIKGEETMSLVNQLVRTAHVNAKKIFQLIRAWLKIIPGVNRFFLEQEAKIKTDKILLVSEEEKKRGSKL